MKNIIENQKKAAKHLEEAAKHQKEAVIHHEAGDHDKAHKCTLKAHGHTAHAVEAQQEIMKHHTTM